MQKQTNMHYGTFYKPIGLNSLKTSWKKKHKRQGTVLDKKSLKRLDNSELYDPSLVLDLRRAVKNWELGIDIKFLGWEVGVGCGLGTAM
jgi:hypothetical protein